jgi:urease accessory protein
MRKEGIFVQALFVLATLFTVSNALAHPIGNQLFGTAGWLHPFSGYDHLLAMVAVGLWSSRTGGWARLALPVSFLSGVFGGGLLAYAGLPLAFNETAVIFSVFALGIFLLAAMTVRGFVPMFIGMFFGLFHGHAHGTEMTYQVFLATPFLGFLAGTAALHLFGVGLGEFLKHLRWNWAFRAAGAMMTVWAGIQLLA